jgi:myo-inositol-1(or 4)-monophosphatase
VTHRRSLDGASVSMLRPRAENFSAWNAVARRAGRVRVLGSSVLEACLVADGAVDAFCDPGGEVHRIVDLAAADLIVRQAGGCLVDVHARPLNFDPDLRQRWSGVVAASPQLADEIVAAVLGD